MQPRKTLKSQPSQLLNLAAEKAIRYVDNAGQRRVGPSSSDLAALAGFHETFPAGPSNPADVLNQLEATGSPATVATTGGRYFGFVNGGMVPAALAASWLAAAWNQNASFRVMSPVAVELEDLVLQWICEALGLPSDCHGGLVTCATMASFTALLAARHALLKKAGWDVTEDGMFGAPPIQVVVGAEIHASVLKALSMAGFGKKRVTIADADGQGRMRGDRLPQLSERTIVCIQAGNVNTGAFDPAEEICAAAKQQGLLRKSARQPNSKGPGSTWMAHSVSGRVFHPSTRTLRVATRTPILGRPMPTSGPTQDMTAAWSF